MILNIIKEICLRFQITQCKCIMTNHLCVVASCDHDSIQYNCRLPSLSNLEHEQVQKGPTTQNPIKMQ